MQQTAFDIHITHSGDMDAHAQAQPGWALRYEQLSAGQFSGRLQRTHLAGLTVLREDTNVAVRQHGRLDPESYGFAMALQPAGEVFFEGQRVPSDAIMCGKGNRLDLTLPSAFSLIAIVVGRDLLNPFWEAMHHAPLARWLEGQWAVDAGSTRANAVRRVHVATLASALAHAARPPDDNVVRQLRDELLAEWLEAIPPEVDDKQLPNRARRKQLVDGATALMLQEQETPKTMLEICAALGTSRRTLNYVFQDVLGTSPVHYFRAVRLNAVRRELLAGAPMGAQRGSGADSEPGAKANGPKNSVQDIAARWGFWHLSQFAQDYRKLFGELPSATLKGR
jgi:AraC family transcriptional regulator, ethanolamine operon transcriptional activator